MLKTLTTIALIALSSNALSQTKQPDLTGTLSFDVGSTSGRVESLAVTIGDGGTGPYKAILAGDPTLPTHTIYRPRSLQPFGKSIKMPIVAFGNGGCRNSSGEFRNFLSEIASHGYLVVAVGPAGDAVVAGSESSLLQTQASQLMDGVDWAISQSKQVGSDYYGKVNTSKVALMGQSCGTFQAMEESGDPRVTTTVLLNGGGKLTALPQGTPDQKPTSTPTSEAAGSYGSATTSTTDMLNGLEVMTKRYAPYALVAHPDLSILTAPKPEVPFHGSVAFINGGPSDLAYKAAMGGYDAVKNVPALLAFEDVGHYPATFREAHGGAFAVAVDSWLDWQLKGDKLASKMFIGAQCGLCQNSKWTVQVKNVQ